MSLVSVLLFLCAATGISAFSVTVNGPVKRVKENEGIDLTCTHSADFGSNARVEWKFKDSKGSQSYVMFDGKPTQTYAGRMTLYGGSNLRFSKVTRKDNGDYSCEVSGANSQFGEGNVKLIVLVPPSPPLCRIPASVTTGKNVILSCHDADGSPPSTYSWYRNDVLMPADPRTVASFRNNTYNLNPVNGNLEFPSVAKIDAAKYHCVASNDAGPPQQCRPVKMDVRDPNTGGIIAGVLIALLLVGLLIFGVWYANKKGYLPKKSQSQPKTNVVYQPTSEYGGDDYDGDFKQKSSFVV